VRHVKFARHLVVCVSVILFCFDVFRTTSLLYFRPDKHPISGWVQDPMEWWGFALWSIAAVWVISVVETGLVICIAWRNNRQDDSSTSEQPAAV